MLDLLKNFDELLKKYADLIVTTGINVQKGQTIIVYTDVTQYELARLIATKAYALGAEEVLFKLTDSKVQKAFLNNTSTERLSHAYEFEKLAAKELMAKNASRISILSEAPDEFSDVAADRIATYQKTYTQARKVVRDKTMNNDISWLVVAAAGKDWAQMVFKDAPNAETAVDQLWQAIFETTRVTDPDPIKSWQEHVAFLNQKADWLNKHRFQALQFVSNQTNITIGLAHNHEWQAAGSYDKAGNFFIPNMPTEEVFTAPNSHQINGTVSSTLPLSHNGQLIENIQLTFKDGKVIKATASAGEELLNHIINTDAGATSLGEVALVPQKSPIAETNLIFYNTLFDENASDHIALGAGYPFTIQDSANYSADQLAEWGLNDSSIHVDFMIGSNDMNVYGIDENNHQTPVMLDGNWA